MTEVILGLGSNRCFECKDSVTLLAEACLCLEGILNSVVFSSLYETKAMYVTNQSNFFNMAVKGFIKDDFSPFVLLEKIHEIEAKFGRNRAEEIRFGARSLDIDIEEFGNLKMDLPELTLPHPRMKDREFVLIPVLEILNESADSLRRKKIISFLQELPEQGVKKCCVEVQDKFKKLTNSKRNFFNLSESKNTV